MSCELCGLDAAVYGQTLRYFECARICLGCYLEIHGIAWDAPSRQQAERTFVLDLGREDATYTLYVPVPDNATVTKGA